MVTPDLPPGTTAHDRPAGGDTREWDLDVSGSGAGAVRVAVVVSLPAAERVRLPEVWCGVGGAVPAPGGVVRWVGVTGATRGFRMDGATPVSPAETTAIQAGWPGEAERLRRAGGTAWAVPPGTAGTPIMVLPAAAAPAPAIPLTRASATPAAAARPTAPGPELRRPAFGALAWGAAVFVVGVLFARAPRLTWPEQVGLLGALFGLAVAGEWAVGAAVYGLARLGWFTVRRKRRPA
jgi:hypothetical protein